MKHFKKATNKHLGELLVERGVINREQLNISLEHQKTNPGHLLGEVLVELKFATEKDIAQALTCQYGFPYLPLSSYEIDAEVIRSVPENVCRQFCLVPIDKIGKSLTVAMSNPLNIQTLEDVELITGC
ncbi:MAG: type II secretion system protein GspE, partial [Candidatus Omnitrophica bacterium]|nr:type II secretion system protein GspE [Candidatus Omnitrophota bacterium]